MSSESCSVPGSREEAECPPSTPVVDKLPAWQSSETQFSWCVLFWCELCALSPGKEMSAHTVCEH